MPGSLQSVGVNTLNEMGVSELVPVEAPPEDSGAVGEWAAGLARRWSVAVR